MISLSPKAIRFIAEALEVQIASYKSQLEQAGLDEDRAADLTNDLMFLEALLEDLKRSLAQPTAPVF
ncbi:hypothetical protein [Leptodesmis sichuanensis]|uniref:hypothetical protein n=1 Tax=Leptodesmis sichuanensis TaxID=2906798 RepID=UPI001F30A7FA|nr:hypothetical protein [Leptodesmis sichuanensis]UIE36880.1 hypothetical protein KIK02_17955 [Leptodesmis sichuanensis A121]